MLEYKNIVWHMYHGALLPETPPHQNIILSKTEADDLLKKSGAYFLRWTNTYDQGSKQFWYIIKDTTERLEDYKSKVRYQIKKGLKSYSVKKVSSEFLVENGYGIYKKAFEKYETSTKPVSLNIFQNSFKNKINTHRKKYEFWGVFHKESGKFMAFSENIIQDNMCHYSVIKFHPDCLKDYAGYALIYIMNHYYLSECNLDYVSDGARSISHKTEIQDFLVQKFRFRRAYANLHIHYRLDIRIMVILLFPFRGLFGFFQTSTLKKIGTLLKQEEIRRSNRQNANEERKAING